MQVNELSDRRADAGDADARLRGPFDAVEDVDPAAVLDALTDPRCRRVLGCARTPVTARDVAEAADLSTSTAYRKLHALADAGLLETQTELSEDGYHTTRYRTTLEAVTVRVDGEELGVSVERSTGED